MTVPSDNGQPTDLKALVTTTSYPPEVVSEKTQAIYDAVLRESTRIKAGDFTAIAVADLERLFALYDASFFAGALGRALARDGSPLEFRLAPRLTRAGGKTYRARLGSSQAGQKPRYEYQVAVSTTLLFQSFHDVRREVVINGLACADRLTALQRVFEHELLHLTELLVWGKSSCAGERFLGLGLRLFGHTGAAHDLVTQHERAHVAHGLRVGDQVVFEHKGTRYQGLLNRITRRATILVEDPSGLRYSDGRVYVKFYVPLALLRRADGSEA
jgi:hypothetical protein